MGNLIECHKIIFIILKVIVRLINQSSEGSYFGTFFLHTVRGLVFLYSGDFEEPIKQLSKRVVLWQGPHNIIAMDVQNVSWCLHYLDLCE